MHLTLALIVLGMYSLCSFLSKDEHRKNWRIIVLVGERAREATNKIDIYTHTQTHTCLQTCMHTQTKDPHSSFATLFPPPSNLPVREESHNCHSPRYTQSGCYSQVSLSGLARGKCHPVPWHSPHWWVLVVAQSICPAWQHSLWMMAAPNTGKSYIYFNDKSI